MTVHPEERRIAGLLRELVVQSGVALETLEKSLGWKPGRLLDLIEGRLRLSIEDILEVQPADFLGRASIRELRVRISSRACCSWSATRWSWSRAARVSTFTRRAWKIGTVVITVRLTSSTSPSFTYTVARSSETNATS